jgi:hypothetical protein
MITITPPTVAASATWHHTTEPDTITSRDRPALATVCDDCGLATVGPVATILHYLGGCRR